MDRQSRAHPPGNRERVPHRQKRERRVPGPTPKQRERMVLRYLLEVEECDIEVNGRIEHCREDPMAQAFECDRCHTFHRGEPYFVSMADQQITTTLDWEICETCKEEIETLLIRKEQEEKAKQP